MIKLSSETVVALSDAAKLLPRRRRGKKPHRATLYRWASRGLRGTRLEVIRVGGTTCTSHEALQRFFDRLTAATANDTPVHSRTPVGQQRTDEQAEGELKSAGF